MNDSHIVSISQIKELLKIQGSLQFKSISLKERYHWINKILDRFSYFKLKKKEKGIVKQYLKQMTGLSRSQVTKLIKRKKKTGRVEYYSTKRYSFPVKYQSEDIALLACTDELHDLLSGRAVKKIMQREVVVFGNDEFNRLKDISVSHIYNLRKTRQYQSKTKFFTKTRPTKVNIGERRKPNPRNKPGYLRVDTVHQGDLNEKKGVYHINLVDEITQWEVVASTEKISESYLIPVLENALNQFPFEISNFHSDNGSEYINKVVARLLNKLLIKQTKSRARKCNDNGLVETKNGSIIRKHMGYVYIKQKYAPLINRFYQKHFNVYLNYHRPCGFATIKVDKKGKLKKVYNMYQVPYDALKKLPEASRYLKKGISFDSLDRIAKEMSDNESAKIMKDKKDKLFRSFNNFN